MSARMCLTVGYGPGRVFHWHRPKTDIVNCENTKAPQKGLKPEWSNPSPGVWVRTDSRARDFFSEFPEAATVGSRHGLDPDPPRCWSCGHPFDAGCECTCCTDDDPHGEWNPDA